MVIMMTLTLRDEVFSITGELNAPTDVDMI